MRWPQSQNDVIHQANFDKNMQPGQKTIILSEGKKPSMKRPCVQDEGFGEIPEKAPTPEWEYTSRHKAKRDLW